MSEEKKPHPFSKEARDAKKKEQEIAQAQEELQVSEKYPVDRDKEYVFKLLTPKRGSTIIMPRCVVRDQNQGGAETTIRYVSGKQTLYEEEQGEIRGGVLMPIEFFNGELRVSGQEELKVRFLLMADWFEGNPNRISGKRPIYRLENPDKVLQAENNRLMYEMKALGIVAGKSLEELKPLARVMLSLGDDAPEMEIRNKLMRKAKENPDLVVKQLANPATYRQYIIEKALEKNVISNTAIPDCFTWVASSKVILHAKKNNDKTPIEQLTQYTFDHTEGEQLFKDIEAAIQ